MAISFDEVIENGLLSEEVIDCLPRECECGGEIMFTDTVRQIYCSNPMCIYKVASRLEAMAVAMQAEGWGESTCVTVCKEFGIKSPYQVFLLEDMVEKGHTSSVSAFNKKVASICDRSRRKYKLWEVVSLANIPSINTIAYKIFDGYDNLTEAYEHIEKGQVPFIANKLGIKKTEGSVMAVNVYNTLIKYKEELLFGETQFEIYKPTGMTIQIAITGGVSGYRNKSEFIKYINNRYGDKVNAMLMNSVTQEVDILVADGDTSSSKYRKAVSINNKYLENSLRQGLFNREDIGRFLDSRDLHPVGEHILITDGDGVIERLDNMFI